MTFCKVNNCLWVHLNESGNKYYCTLLAVSPFYLHQQNIIVNNNNGNAFEEIKKREYSLYIKCHTLSDIFTISEIWCNIKKDIIRRFVERVFYCATQEINKENTEHTLTWTFCILCDKWNDLKILEGIFLSAWSVSLLDFLSADDSFLCVWVKQWYLFYNFHFFSLIH